MNGDRQFVRFHCEHPLWVRPIKGADDEYQLAQVQNISAGGAFFISNGPIEAGQTLELTMEVPQQYKMLTLRGPVRHVAKENGFYRCGLKFEEREMSPTLFSQYIQSAFSQPEET